MNPEETRRTRSKRRASSTDVARLAGVSQSAVSRAYTPGAKISEATRRKVESAADTLGYRPNALGRFLITSRTNMIALLTSDLQHPFYAKIVNAISLRLQAAGLHVLLFSITHEDRIDPALEELLKYSIDGVMLTSAELSTDMALACRRIGTPVVLYNRGANVPGVSAVRVDNVTACLAVAEHLVTAGHRRIGFIAGSSIDGINAEREQGFVAGLARHGFAPAARYEGDFSFESGQAGFRALWSAGRLDAIFCASDRMAMGAMDAARFELGLRVPQDVAVVGFDDLPSAAYPSYDLTTIRQPVEAMAHAAVDLLVSKIGEPATMARTILLPGELVVRGSSPARC